MRSRTAGHRLELIRTTRLLGEIACVNREFDAMENFVKEAAALATSYTGKASQAAVDQSVKRTWALAMFAAWAAAQTDASPEAERLAQQYAATARTGSLICNARRA